MLGILLVLFSLIPPSEPVTDSVDLIEVNHFHDEQGRLVFDQVIFYDWCPKECRYQVRAWRLLKSKSQMPRQGHEGFEIVWHDGQDLRRVRARAMFETWTQYDPELCERSVLPKEMRRKLGCPPLRKGIVWIGEE